MGMSWRRTRCVCVWCVAPRDEDRENVIKKWARSFLLLLLLRGVIKPNYLDRIICVCLLYTHTSAERRYSSLTLSLTYTHTQTREKETRQKKRKKGGKFESPKLVGKRTLDPSTSSSLSLDLLLFFFFFFCFVCKSICVGANNKNVDTHNKKKWRK
jgi:hypothetical protein